ncbi:hypothetical protein AB4305_00065 [Nocardia sp. 2YAB30]|uniref:hypothetical protein n=1 Tax=unclassified Nocardia TaxID=2637762 RepID=UPI003F961CA9
MNTSRWHDNLAEELNIEAPAHRPVTVLRDAADTATLTHALLAAHNSTQGTVTVHPTPSTKSGLALAADVAAALGCSITRIAPEKVAAVEPLSRAVLAWFRALRVRHLVVLRAHTLTPDQLAWLLRVRRSADVHLVLAWHHPGPFGHPQFALDQLTHRLIEDPRVVLDEIAVASTTMPALAGGDLPQVPDAGVRTFRADAADALAPEQFARVDAVYTGAIETTCAWISSHTGHSCAHAHTDEGSGVWLGTEDADYAERMLQALHSRHAHLRRLYECRPDAGLAHWHETLTLFRLLAATVADSPGRYTTLTRLRGVQVGFELHGITLELPPNLAYSVGPGMTTTPFDHQLAERIRTRTANPAYAAAVAISLFTGATVRELKTITCLAYAFDILVGIDTIDRTDPTRLCVWPVPPAARPLLEAALLFQETAPEPGGLLLAGGLGALGQILRDTFTETGLTTPARHPWHQNWIWQTGILWRGLPPRSRPLTRKPPHRRPNQPTFQRVPREPDLVPIEEPVYRHRR